MIDCNNEVLKMGKIKDIYECELFEIWEDGESYFFNLYQNGLTFCLPKENALELIEEFKKIEV